LTTRRPTPACFATSEIYRAYPQLKIEASSFDLAEIGDEWVFGLWLKGEDDMIKAAYDFAAER